MRCGIGLDLGGSSAKIGLVAEQGEILAERRVALETGDASALLKPIALAADQLIAQAADLGAVVAAIGCGIPGYLDAARVRVDLNNIPALNGFALAPWLRERFGLPAAIDNDACMAAFAESALLAPNEAQRLLVVTVGSGIGVVLVVDGQIVRLMHGVTNDAGHILVDHTNGERCLIGCRGCLETVATAGAIARAGQQAAANGASPPLVEMARSRQISGADVSAAASAGDAVAREIILQAGHWLGIGLASWAPIYEPDLILIGGGVAEAGEGWLAAAISAMREFGHPFFVCKIAVRKARLGNRAGIVGAALMALREGC